jgi:hypothetical protein
VPLVPDARFAVVVTHNRPAELELCLRAIVPQVDRVVVIDNASRPPAAIPDDLAAKTVLGVDLEQPPNLSRMWNVGLDGISRNVCRDVAAWDVAVLNDDAIVPPGWMATVGGEVRRLGAAAGCSVGDRSAVTLLHGATAAPSVATRLTGWAFLLVGEAGLRADERLRWWAGDDDLSAKARLAGGVVHVPGLPVPNLHADQTTRGVLAEQAGRDMATFVDIWGRRPW